MEYNDKLDSFACLFGVSQGENVYPLLFSIFLNDLKSVLDKNLGGGIQLDSTSDKLTLYLKDLLLLYVDDVVIPEETHVDIPHTMDHFANWNIEIEGQYW